MFNAAGLANPAIDKLIRLVEEAQDRAELTQRLGLNDPVVVQYKNWASDLFFRGDLGQSSRTNEEVSKMLRRSMGNTLQLLFWGAGFSAR